MSSGEEQKQEPSMIGGHVKYVQGVISSALGYETGNETKESAVQEMRDAKKTEEPKDSVPVQSGILSSIEGTAGNLTGCDGLVNDAKTRKPVGGIEEASGTG